MAEQTHQSDPRILNRRTLHRDHPRLCQFLEPGMSVLDVGCGTGAITSGIAAAVGTEGRVVGVDRDASLLGIARSEHAGIPNLVFEVADATALPFDRRFDLVTAARTIQWVSQPQAALAHMCRAARARGHVVVLDYNHALNSWEPPPPAEFQTFYAAFLRWRDDNNWNNMMADRLPEIFRACGLSEVQAWTDDDIADRGSPDFTDQALIWEQVAKSLGGHLISGGYITEEQRHDAATCYREFVQHGLERQTLSMRTVSGVRA